MSGSAVGRKARASNSSAKRLSKPLIGMSCPTGDELKASRSMIVSIEAVALNYAHGISSLAGKFTG